MAQMSKHPLSLAINNHYHEPKFALDVQENQGFGLVAQFEGREVRLGRKDFCNITSAAENQALEAANSQNGSATHCFLKHGENELILLFCDEIKEDAAEVLQKLQKMGKRTILLSGDNFKAVKAVAQALNIGEFYFEQTPVSKVELLKDLKQKGLGLMMVGDGLNDAPSLAFADVSVSFSKAVDITQSISDIVIQGNKLAPILTLTKLCDRSIKLIKQNLIMALGYNLIAVPFAIAGSVTPLVAALAMSSSSILVLLNSLRILR